MAGEGVLIILDILVIISLSFSVVYMFVLTKHIKNIREGKHDLQRLISDLSSNITKAGNAIQDMKKTADQKGRDIQRLIDQANSIIDEMNFINKACDNVAERLGKLVTQGSAIVEKKQDEEIKAIRKENLREDLQEDKKQDAKKKTERKPLRASAPEEGEEEEGMSRSEKDLVDAIKKRYKGSDD